jgi:UDP-N-acetylglucosamine:LPS N-acetylglucosamine transferase
MSQKVLAIASRGGHWVQLLRLREAFEDVDVMYVTTVRDYRSMVNGARFRVVCEANRHQKLRMLLLALQMAWILLRERPTAIVTTGAAPGFLGIRLGKLLGARTLWLDSIANAEGLSMSGQLAARHADVVLTQWEHLDGEEGAQYQGAVI